MIRLVGNSTGKLDYDKNFKKYLTKSPNCDKMIHVFKGVDEEVAARVPQREMAVGASHRECAAFVASEPRGRKQFCRRPSP